MKEEYTEGKSVPMTKNEKMDLMESGADNQPASINSINDGELENVSGGITIYDTCTNQLEPFTCLQAFWGKCPRLIIEEKRLFFESNPSYGFEYILSCSKGCFSKEKLTSNFDR